MFLPLRDENPSGKFAFVNLSLVLVNIMLFVYELTLSPHFLRSFELANAVVPARITAWANGYATFEAAFLPLITSMFLHGGFAHILGNMLFLWIFGDNVEANFGHLPYLIFYFLCGIGAGLVHIAFNFNSHLPALGASGAISGVMGAYIVLEPRNRILSLFFIFLTPVPAVLVLGIWFAMQFLSAISSFGTTMNGGVAVWAHVGGFIIGVIVASTFKRR